MEAYEREVELIDYLEVLLKRKKLLIGATLICALAAAVFSLRQPRLYEAEALVVVSPSIAEASNARPPQHKAGETFPPPGTNLFIPGLAAQTYEVLAKSDELMYLLADTLLHTLDPGTLEKWAPAPRSPLQLGSALGEALEVELEKETLKAQSPLLRFRYRSSQEALPVQVVNWWSALFVQRHQGLSSHVTDEFYQRVQLQYDQARTQLEAAEEKLRHFRAGYHTLNVVKSEIAFKNTRLDSALKKSQKLETELQAKKRQRSYLQKLLRPLEYKGEWIGYLPPEQLSPLRPASEMCRQLIEVLTSLEQLEADSIATYQQQARRRQQFEDEANERLLSFAQQEQSEHWRQRQQHINTALSSYDRENAALEQKLKETRIALEVRRQRRETLSPVLVVSKAVSDDALWNQLGKEGRVDPQAQHSLGQYSLQSEVLNPVYQKLQAQINDLEVQYATAAARREFLREEIPRLQQERLQVQTHLDSLEQRQTRLQQSIAAARLELERKLQPQSDALQTALARKRRTFADHRRYYLEQKQKQEALERKLAELSQESAFYQRDFDDWSGDLRLLAVAADSMDLELTRLERNLSIYQQTFDRFAQLREEARIAREQAAGDIQVISRATIPRALPRKTLQKTAIASLIGLMLAAFLAFLLEYTAKARERAGAATPEPLPASPDAL